MVGLQELSVSHSGVKSNRIALPRLFLFWQQFWLQIDPVPPRSHYTLSNYQQYTTAEENKSFITQLNGKEKRCLRIVLR